MKTFKLTLLAILAIGLLTAVLPSSDIEPTNEISNHKIKKTEIKLAGIIHKKGTVPPKQG